MKEFYSKRKLTKILIGILIFGIVPAVFGAMQSSTYKIPFDSLNISGGSEDSASYGLSEAVGQLASGESESSNYRLRAGFFTDLPPVLIFNVTSNSVDLGTLSTSGPAAATSTFDAATNADYGYAVTISGSTLTHSGGSATIDAMANTLPSSPGTEQFGINLVANTSPSVGVNPSGGSGQAASGYNTANNFKFVSGETIASANSFSSTTYYNISYLANIATSTEAGIYNTNLDLIVTATF